MLIKYALRGGGVILISDNALSVTRQSPRNGKTRLIKGVASPQGKIQLKCDLQELFSQIMALLYRECKNVVTKLSLPLLSLVIEDALVEVSHIIAGGRGHSLYRSHYFLL